VAKNVQTATVVEDPFDFTEHSDVILPTGGGGMVSRGFIAPWTAKVLYTAMAQESHRDTFTDAGVTFEETPAGSDWLKYYFLTYEDAQAALEATDKKVRSNQVWHLSTKTRDVLNADVEKLEHGTSGKGFGPRISYEVPLVSLSSGDRHRQHMILLPSFVHSVATLKGWAVPELDWSEISNTRDYIPSDDEQVRLIGHPDVKVADDERHYTHSILWGQRAALWAVLGENDATAYMEKDMQVRGKPAKFTTTSDKLNFALALFKDTWKKPVWMRVVAVADPAMKNKIKSSGKAGTVPIVVDMWGVGGDAEAKARAAAESERSGEEDSAPSGGSANGSAKLVPPGDWRDMKDEWLSSLGSALSEGKNLPQINEELDVKLTPPQLAAWKKELGL